MMFKFEVDPAIRELFSLMTVTEAADRFGKHENTVLKAIDEGKLDCRKSGSIYLIRADSLIKLWGHPKPPDFGSVELTLPKWQR